MNLSYVNLNIILVLVWYTKKLKDWILPTKDNQLDTIRFYIHVLEKRNKVFKSFYLP